MCADKKNKEKSENVILRAADDPVISYDETGLSLRLSDKVIQDVDLRLKALNAPPLASNSEEEGEASPAYQLEGIDAWDVQSDDQWLYFHARLPGRQGPRRFRKALKETPIIAETPGPLYGILAIGGARAGLGDPIEGAFPYHIFAPADDIGAVGQGGVGNATTTSQLEPMREATHEVRVAETLLNKELETYAPLQLFVTRAETDMSPDIASLSTGLAFKNFLTAARNIAEAAKALKKKAKILCVSVDFVLEDQLSDARQYRDGMIALMENISNALGALGFQRPLFVTRFEAGIEAAPKAATIDGQWELVWNHGDHDLLFSAPSYMFSLDEYDRPTRDARCQMGEMTAAAILEKDDWLCPTFLLAEGLREDASLIRVILKASRNLVIDAEDPFDAGRNCGFSIEAADGARPVTIKAVKIDPDDPMALLIEVSRALSKSDELVLSYAAASKGRSSLRTDHKNGPNRGALRDEWSMKSTTGVNLHRWALPARLSIKMEGAA